MHNFADQNGPEVFGTIRLHDALVHSVNSVFCNIGKELGAIPILRQGERFGFYSAPPLETPIDERRASGLYQNGKLFFPARESQVDPGRMAFGQERLLVTPLQMAMVAGAIGNNGVEMQPYVVSRIVSPGGKTIVEDEAATKLARPVSQDTAPALQEMMVDVVRRGTGTAVAIPGLRIGGKTGTAETGVTGRNTTWFICFAGPDDGTLRGSPSPSSSRARRSTGGATAAPIARQVIEALLPQAGNP